MKKHKHLPAAFILQSIEVRLSVNSTMLDGNLIETRDDDGRGEVEDVASFISYESYSGVNGQKTKLDSKHDIPSHPLVSRESQIHLIKEAFERLSQTKSGELLIVTGACGTGKTSLIEQLRQPLTSQGAFFLSAKFDSIFQTNDVYQTLMGAFSDLCDLLLQSENILQQRKVLKQALGEEAMLLLNLIPTLSKVLNVEPQPLDKNVGRERAFSRFKNACKTFLKTVATSCHPVVLFIDDVHNAEEGSLRIIESILQDTDTAHIMIILTCTEHPRERLNLDKVKWPRSQINLGALNEEDANLLISQLLGQPAENTQELTKVVVAKTDGNPFHLLTFMQLAQKEGIIRYSSGDPIWTWNSQLIQEGAHFSENVMELLTYKISKLRDHEQRVLQLAALLGYVFDTSFLSEIIAVDVRQNEGQSMTGKLDEIIQLAICEGLIQCCKDGNDLYRFSHDLIQNALYDMIGRDTKKELHSKVGEVALTKPEENYVFMAAEQLNRACIREKEMDMIQLNIRAARHALSKSAFHPAIQFLCLALKWVSGDFWSEMYFTTTLEIQTMLVQAHYGCGNLDMAKKHIDEVIQCRASLKSKIKSYFSLIEILGAQGLLEEAISVCQKVLGELGEKFPKKPTMRQVMFQNMKIKNQLRNKTDAMLSSLPQCSCEEKIATIKLLGDLSMFAYFLQIPELLCFSTVRMMNLTLVNGLSPMAPYAFCWYGMVNAFLGSPSDAYRFGALAKRMVERNESRLTARILTLACSFCLHWQSPPTTIGEILKRAYRSAQTWGEIDSASHAATNLMNISFCWGRHLFEIEEESRCFCQEMSNHSQVTALALAVPFWQGVLNLMGRCEDPLKLNGDAMREAEAMSEAISSHSILVQLTISFVRLHMAVYFRAWDMGLEMITKIESQIKLFEASYNYWIFKFLCAVVFLAIDRKTKKKKHRGKAVKIIKQMKKSELVSFQAIILLLEAELASLGSDKKGLKLLYDLAIEAAREKDHIHFRALANEMSGYAFLNYDDYLADQYLSEALEYYFQWGCMAKVDRLEAEHQSLHSKPKVVTSQSSGSRGSRTNSTKSDKRRSKNRAKTEAMKGATPFSIPKVDGKV